MNNKNKIRDIEALLRFAGELADLSRQIILSHPIQEVKHWIKNDASPVTSVDREVEKRLREHIDNHYPHHGIFGEEFPNQNIDAERVWVIDPIDGTRQFATGVPLYGTLIGLAEEGRFVLGVMDFPATRDRWVGGQGIPVQWNDCQVSVSRCNNLSQAITSRSEPDRCNEEEHLKSTRLADVGPFSICGAGSYGFAMLASGKLDIVIDTGLDPFDFAAPVAIIEAAGGLTTDWQGQPLTLSSKGQILFVGNPELHAPALDLLNG